MNNTYSSPLEVITIPNAAKFSGLTYVSDIDSNKQCIGKA